MYMYTRKPSTPAAMYMHVYACVPVASDIYLVMYARGIVQLVLASTRQVSTCTYMYLHVPSQSLIIVALALWHIRHV